MKKEERESFMCGALAALGIIYEADEETTAEEIISLIGPYALLRVAKKNQDIYLPNLRKTIKFLREKERSGNLR